VNTQEYELAFVGTLPKNVRVVDPHTLDFSKNPAGALAFRYKHGWILINPLIPSRGLSGGGLARQHGHISGGHTTGHFIKGADGKMSFKAVDRYASKADWENAVKKGAAGVVAKQEAAKAAVQKAESATNAAEKLAASGASKDVQAAAHAVASKAHADAVPHFQAMGKGGLKSAVLTHSAHSAIHASKADKLGQEAKVEKAAKLEAEKVAAKAHAKKLTDGANELTASLKGGSHSPKQAAELHQKAAKAHADAKTANEAAGNKFLAEAHGQAVGKHEGIAEKQQAAHDSLASAADNLSAQAEKSSKAAKIAQEEGDNLPSQIHAHKQAADAHGQAANMHQSIGQTDAHQAHLTQKMGHQAEAANLTAQHDKEQEAKAKAQAEADKISDEAWKVSEGAWKTPGSAGGAGATADAQDAHLKAAKAHLKAKIAAKAAGDTDLVQAHNEAIIKHQNQSVQVGNDVVKHAEEKKKAESAASSASVKAHSATEAAHNAKYEGNATPQQLSGLHLDAGGAHLDAAEAAHKAGWTGVADDHTEAAKGHAAEAKKLAAAHDAELKAKEDKKAKLMQAGDLLNEADDAMKAGNPELAAQKAKEAAKVAEEGGHTSLMVNALSDLAEITNTKEDHQAAGTAAAKALGSEIQKAAPDQSVLNKYKFQMTHHGNSADALTTKQAAEVKNPPSVKAPAAATSENGLPLKPVGKLTPTGQTLGSHDNKLMKDEAGNEWLVKQDEYSRTLDPAIAKLHRMVGMDTPIFVKTKDGHLQGMLPGSKDAFPNGSFDPTKLSEADILSMLQHQVMDSATGNQDTHSGQWLRTADGKLVQVDQGQAFKYGTHADPTKTYPPLGADVPVYPKLWNAAKAGHVKLPDPQGNNSFADTIKAIQDMPDEEFKKLFRPYAEHAQQNGQIPGGKTVDGFLDDIAAHKNKIGDEFQKLYNGLPDKAKAGSSVAHNADHAKAAALKAIAENGQAGKSLHSGLIQKAKESGASLSEIHSAHHGEPSGALAAKKGKPTSGLSQKDTALKAFAEHNSPANDENWEPDTSNELKDKAKALGATQAEINAALDDPDKFVADLSSKSAAAKAANPGGVSPEKKAAALKALAEHMQSDDTDWAPSDYKKLKQDALDAGATMTDIKDVLHNADKYLEPQPSGGLSAKEKALKAVAEHEHPKNDGAWSYDKANKLEQDAKAAGADDNEIMKAAHKPAEVLAELTTKEETGAAHTTGGGDAPKATPEPPKAQVTPAAPSKPAVDPFKPKAKWTKGLKGLKTPDGEMEEHPVVQGPKGLVVHKKINGTGWHVSSADGLTMGKAFKTQKEAKLAAEWMAKNHGSSKAITTESHKAWMAANPADAAQFKAHVANSQWNKEAQAELNAHNAPSGASDAGSKKFALQLLAEYNLTGSSDNWDYEKDANLKQAAKNAGATAEEITAAAHKPKTYLKALGLNPDATVSAAPSAPHVMFTGLTNNKHDNAQLLKKLYAQSMYPNATAADKAEYAKAQDAWIKKHSTGPFDPDKVFALGQNPPMGSNPNPQFGKPKKKVTPGYKGFKPYNPAEGSDYGQGTLDRTALAEFTKQQWTQGSFDAGYRNASFNQNLHGDWRPDPADTGHGSGPYIYSTGDYVGINQQVRGDKKKGIEPFGPTGGKWDDVIAHMDKVFGEVPPLDRNVIVSRKMFGGGPFPTVPPAPPMKPGEVYIDHGYNSTSKTRDVWTGDTHMEIRLPKGSKVLDLNHTTGSDNSGEHEVLLNRDSKFKVIEDTTSTYHGKKVRHIVVELVP
jgi:hypothetical protein